MTAHLPPLAMSTASTSPQLRLETWRRKIETEGGTWRVINDLDRLETLL
jgi:hypothetical protein